jgi:phosphoribosylanthranilate isomerase
VFVKICGITSEEDALLAVAMGADAVGFVFAPSTRQIAAAQARDIARRLPPEVLTVGVFRNDLPERVVQVMHEAGLMAAQLHGRETVAQVAEVRRRLPRVIKAFTPDDPMIDRIEEFAPWAVMLDAPHPGGGKVFDWKTTPRPNTERLILAGGLTPENVAEGINEFFPWGVDVSSGVESEPGRKDPVKVREFVRNARAAFKELQKTHPGVLSDAPYDWMQE